METNETLHYISQKGSVGNSAGEIHKIILLPKYISGQLIWNKTELYT